MLFASPLFDSTLKIQCIILRLFNLSEFLSPLDCCVLHLAIFLNCLLYIALNPWAPCRCAWGSSRLSIAWSSRARSLSSHLLELSLSLSMLLDHLYEFLLLSFLLLFFIHFFVILLRWVRNSILFQLLIQFFNKLFLFRCSLLIRFARFFALNLKKAISFIFLFPSISYELGNLLCFL